jgi:hypothetical protein
MLSRPGLISRFTRWVGSLTLSPWIFYPSILAIWVSLEILGYSLAGALPAGSWTALSILRSVQGGIMSVSILTFSFYLNQEIGEAADASRGISGLSDTQFARTKHGLVTTPLWQELLVGLTFGIISIQAGMFDLGVEKLSLPLALYLLDWFLTASIIFSFAFRVISLIFLIGRFYAGPIQPDLFNLPPLRELSSTVGKAGLFLLLLWYISVPINMSEFVLESPTALSSVVVIALIPLAAFLIPQALLNRRIAREKTRLIVSVSSQLKSAFNRLEEEFDAQNLDEMDHLKAGIEALVTQRKFIEGIPTWPWRLGTFRLTVTAVFFPILVWLIQQILNRFIAF